MRATKSVWLVVLILVLVAVPAMVQGTPRQMLVGLLKPGLFLSIDKGCGAVYQHDELLNITVRSNQSGYLTIFDFLPDGRVQIIFPNAYWQDSYIEGDKEYSIPGKIFPFRFGVAPPDGEEMLFAVITEKPYDLTPSQMHSFQNIFPQFSDRDEDVAYELIEQLGSISSSNWIANALCHFYVGQGPSATVGNGWGLFIGVDNYDDTWYVADDRKRYHFPKLRYCVRGAQEIAMATQPMFPNQRLLLDREATHDNIKRAITEWLSQAPEEATVLIYYSGHGSRIKDQNGDEQDGYDETIVPWDYGRNKKFVVDDELHRWLCMLKANRVILIVDASHSTGLSDTAGMIRVEERQPFPPQLSLTDGTGQVLVVPNKVLLLAAGEIAYERSSFGHGVYTYYILQGIEGLADVDMNGLITAQELHAYVSDKIREGDFNQKPQIIDYTGHEITLAHIPEAGGSIGREVVAGNNAFALELYRVLATGDNNLFFSPYSISTSLSMAYCGARGKTEEEMGSALHFSLPPSAVSSAVATLNKELLQGNGLNMANSLWVQKGYPLTASFINIMKEGYGASPHTVDFSSSPTFAREKINAWVKEQTAGKIEELIPVDGINSTTRLLLVNAIYFSGTWKYLFRALPRLEDFHLLDGTMVKIPMMSVTASVEYMQGEGYQAVVLPYEEGLSMLILVPDQGMFRAFQDSLSGEKVSSILMALEEQTITVTMPKFEYASGFRLREALESLGMESPFSSSANFSGMSKDTLYIGEVFHKAFVHVDERGTEAAAATGTTMSRSLVRNISITVDRPFIFFIRDEESGAILFVGRVVSP